MDQIRLRFYIWAVLAMLLVAGGLGWIVLAGWLFPTTTPLDTVILIGGWISLGLIGVVIVYLLDTTPPNAIKLPRSRSEKLLWTLSAGLLICACTIAIPSLSTDYHRYRLEGRMWIHRTSPYATTPEQFLAQYPADPSERLTQQRDLASVYPPVAQTFFIASRFLEQALNLPPLSGYGLRLLLTVCALIVAATILALLRLENRSPWWAAPVLLGPLFLAESAWNPHVEMVGIMCLLLSFWTLQNGGVISGSTLAGVFLGLACGVKPQVMLVFPFLARAAVVGRWRWVVAGFLMAVAIQLPALLWQGGLHGFRKTFEIYSTSWEANGSLFELLKSLQPLGQDPRAINRLKDGGRLLSMILVVVALYILWKRKAGPLSAAYVLQLILLLTSPVVYPWYVLWVFCLAPMVGGYAVFIWAATASLAYLLGRTSSGWTMPLWATLLEYIPVYIAVGFDYIRAWHPPKVDVNEAP